MFVPADSKHVAPILEATRVRLRPVRPDDLDSFAALGASPEVYRGISGKPSTREECWGKMLKIAGEWVLLDYGSWVVEMRDTGQFIGVVGFMNAERDLDPPQDIAPEAGWSFLPAAHGKGLAHEAMLLALSWFDTQFPGRCSFAIINTDNPASEKLANKLGYAKWGAAQYNGHCVNLWRRYA